MIPPKWMNQWGKVRAEGTAKSSFPEDTKATFSKKRAGTLG